MKLKIMDVLYFGGIANYIPPYRILRPYDESNIKHGKCKCLYMKNLIIHVVRAAIFKYHFTLKEGLEI